MFTISDAIAGDHCDIEQCYNDVTGAEDHDHQERCGKRFVQEVARHNVAEELFLHPVLEKYLGTRGYEITESDRKGHEKIRQLLIEFRDMKPQELEYIPKLKQVWKLLSAHIEEQEQKGLPELELALITAEAAGVSEELAKRFVRVTTLYSLIAAQARTRTAAWSGF